MYRRKEIPVFDHFWFVAKHFSETGND